MITRPLAVLFFALAWVGVETGGGARARAETMVLQPVADTSLFERFPDNNLGGAWLAAGTLASGQRSRALLRFDLSGLPANAVILSASLSVSVVRHPGAAADSRFEIRRMLVPWGEGTNGSPGIDTGGPAVPGDATWRARFAPTALWDTPGGTVGFDFGSSASASVQIVREGDYAFASTPATVADVQGWVAQPTSNFGWMLLSQAETTTATARRFGSRETVGQEPLLTVEYALASPPLRIDQIVRDGPTVELRFAGEAGKLYAVEYAAALGTTNWLVLTEVASKFHPTNFIVVDSALHLPGRWYRVQALGDIDRRRAEFPAAVPAP